jgi:hypothetical protein
VTSDERKGRFQVSGFTCQSLNQDWGFKLDRMSLGSREEEIK